MKSPASGPDGTLSASIHSIYRRHRPTPLIEYHITDFPSLMRNILAFWSAVATSSSSKPVNFIVGGRRIEAADSVEAAASAAGPRSDIDTDSPTYFFNKQVELS
jgi:hypothetical protein